jgi:hypothetical protein
LVQAVFEYIQQQYLRNAGHLGLKQNYARVQLVDPVKSRLMYTTVKQSYARAKLVDPAKSRLEVRDSYYYECCQQEVKGRA